jgi:hypothetical protein
MTAGPTMTTEEIELANAIEDAIRTAGQATIFEGVAKTVCAALRLSAQADVRSGGIDDHMTRARRLVEDHISAYGMVPHPDRIKEAIAEQSQQSFDLGFRAAGGISPAQADVRAAPWVCCHCDAPLSCAACGVEQPDDSEHYRRQEEELVRLRSRQADVRAATIEVPKVALGWLFGETPDADGKWFGEYEDEIPPSKRAYWWRSKFRSMIPALSDAKQPEGK